MRNTALLLLFALNGFCSEVDTALIRQHLNKIVLTERPRNFENIKVLNSVAAYIHETFAKSSSAVTFQEYSVGNNTYKNVIASFGPMDAPRIVVGAHYDVCGIQPGADDNATGVVGLLELGRMLKGTELKYRVDLVAYTLEEPPFFRTDHMGSFIHAKSLKDSSVDVRGMICLEMIGYFSDERKTQDYPLGLLKMFYGGKGDYIAVVRRTGGGKFAKQCKRNLKRANLIKTKGLAAPPGLRGIDFSDHLNYWNLGYSAVMVTNTGFYRNKNYHLPGDKLETIDVPRMALVIQQVYRCLLDQQRR